MLQSGSRHAKLQSILEVLTVQHAADDAARKGIAAAHTIHDGVNAVLLGVIEFLRVSGINAGGPTVVGSGMTDAQGGNAVLKVVIRNHLLEDGLVTCQLQIAAGDIGVAGLVTKYQLSVLLVADSDINILHQVLHNLLCLLGGPQLLAKV